MGMGFTCIFLSDKLGFLIIGTEILRKIRLGNGIKNPPPPSGPSSVIFAPSYETMNYKNIVQYLVVMLRCYLLQSLFSFAVLTLVTFVETVVSKVCTCVSGEWGGQGFHNLMQKTAHFTPKNFWDTM